MPKPVLSFLVALLAVGNLTVASWATFPATASASTLVGVAYTWTGNGDQHSWANALN